MGKSTLIEIQTELVEKQKLVEQCKATLESERTAAEEYVAKKISKAQDALDEAKRDAEEFVASIAQVLGLLNPAAARQGKKRVKRVREMLASGKTEEQIAIELGQPIAVIREDVSKLRSRTVGKSSADADKPPEEGQRGWKRDQVRKLTLEGLGREEVAEKLGIDKSSVNAHICQLRARGKLPRAGEDADDDEGDSEADNDVSDLVTRAEEIETGDLV